MKDGLLKEPNLILAKQLNRVAIVLTIIIFLLVGLMRRVKLDLGVDFSFLPPAHAILNSLAALALIAGIDLYQERRSRHAPQIHLCRHVTVGFIFTVLCDVSLYNS